MQYFVYILATKKDGVIYVGVTNNINRRVYEHKHELVDGFTKKYHIHKVVYVEETKNITEAIAREKQIKSWSRKRKVELIESLNPDWKDLSNND